MSVRSRLGVHDGETPNNTFPQFLERERRYGARLLWSNVQQHAQMSKFYEHDRETTQEIRNNGCMHQSRCACVCLFTAQINKHFMPRNGILLSSWCSNQCAVHIILRPKKKLLINFKTSFSRIVVGKKLLIKTEKVNYSLGYDW